MRERVGPGLGLLLDITEPLTLHHAGPHQVLLPGLHPGTVPG